MKKHVYFFAIGILLFSLQVEAQQTKFARKKKMDKSAISFGIQGGLNVSSVTNAKPNSYGDNNFSQNSKPGFNLGVFAEIPIIAMIHFQPEINYSMKGFRANTDQGMLTRSYNFIDVPLLVKFYPIPHFYVFLGPQLSVKLSTTDSWTINTPDFTKYERRNNDINQLYAGLALGIGVDVTSHLIFNAGYSADFTNTYKYSGDDTPPFRNQVINIRAGYRF